MTGTAEAEPIFRPEQRAVPIALDQIARFGEIVVEAPGQRHAHVRTTIDKAGYRFISAHDEAVKTLPADLQHEVPGARVS